MDMNLREEINAHLKQIKEQESDCFREGQIYILLQLRDKLRK